MMRLSRNLEPFIFNKRVAIVGGADHMTGTKLGNKIDSYDTVVRVNLHWPAPRNIAGSDVTEDIGHRTDVLIVTEMIWKKELCFFKEDPKYVIAIVQTLGGKINSIIDTFFNTNLDLMLAWEANTKFSSIIEYGVPSTGLIAMQLILDAHPSELFITGYDFFTQTHRGWRNHDPVGERKYFKEVILPQEIVTAHEITGMAASSDLGERWGKPGVKRNKKIVSKTLKLFL